VNIDVSQRLLKIIEDISTRWNVSQTRLTVLKTWFEHPGRLPAFGLWMARRAAAGAKKQKGKAGVLLAEARDLLGPATLQEDPAKRIDRKAEKDLQERASAFHCEYSEQRWGRVRVIHCWPLLLVEEGLAIHLGMAKSTSEGYKLAVDWIQNFDALAGNGLNGPSVDRIKELMQFMAEVEAMEKAKPRVRARRSSSATE